MSRTFAFLLACMYQYSRHTKDIIERPLLNNFSSSHDVATQAFYALIRLTRSAAKFDSVLLIFYHPDLASIIVILLVAMRAGFWLCQRRTSLVFWANFAVLKGGAVADIFSFSTGFLE